MDDLEALDHVHPDPAAAHRHWEQPLEVALAEPGALDQVVHHPVGDRPGRYLLRIRCPDLALHACDLAGSLLPLERPAQSTTPTRFAELLRRTGRGRSLSSRATRPGRGR